jgi:hypothetical protein
MWHDTYQTTFEGHPVRLDFFINGPEVDAESFVITFPDGSRLKVEKEGADMSREGWFDESMWTTDEGRNRLASQHFQRLFGPMREQATDKRIDLDIIGLGDGDVAFRPHFFTAEGGRALVTDDEPLPF